MSLALQQDTDYRIIYMAERAFKERVEDVYIAKQTQKKPPLFHHLLEELVDIEACLFLMHHGDEVFADYSNEQRLELIRRIEVEDYEALELVISRIDVRFVEMFARDLMLFLLAHQYMFFEQDPYDRNHVTVHNSSIQSVW